MHRFYTANSVAQGENGRICSLTPSFPGFLNSLNHPSVSSPCGNEHPPEARKHIPSAVRAGSPFSRASRAAEHFLSSGGRAGDVTSPQGLARLLPAGAPRRHLSRHGGTEHFQRKRRSKPIRTEGPGRAARGSALRASRRTARALGAALFGGTRHGGGTPAAACGEDDPPRCHGPGGIREPTRGTRLILRPGTRPAPASGRHYIT
jgi:hypothetical protein